MIDDYFDSQIMQGKRRVDWLSLMNRSNRIAFSLDGTLKLSNISLRQATVESIQELSDQLFLKLALQTIKKCRRIFLLGKESKN